MKLGPVTKPDRTNKTTSKKKKKDDDAMSKNWDIIVIFVIFGRFGAIRKPYSGCIVVQINRYIPINKGTIFTKKW